MKLNEIRVQNHKSIDDSGWVPIDDITALVGKNESGKTAIMEAVEKINPSFGPGEYNEYKGYPRSEYVEYQRARSSGQEAAVVASAKFSLQDIEKEEIQEKYGKDILSTDRVIVKKDYDNNLHWEVGIDESQYVSVQISNYDLPDRTEEKLMRSSNLDELKRNVKESESTSEALNRLDDDISGLDLNAISNEIGNSVLKDYLPKFRYMGDYTVMDSIIGVDDLIQKESSGDLRPSDEVFLSLLSVVNLDLEEIKEQPDWEKIITQLEAAQSHVTNYMMEYWTQNENIKIQFNRETATEEGPSRYNSGQILQVRVLNIETDATVDFDQRSLGFRWFFSSFCHFSDIQESENKLILLLDEPGLHLHAKAQQDFLNFLEDELSEKHTVIYSTHSPFMIEPRQLHRAKMVMAEPGGHTNITTDILQTDEDTRFPLQTVFEFDLIDTLLIRPQTLLVEGKSDQKYIYTMSEILDSLGNEGLDRKWTVLNVGSGDNVPSFVSLFGANDLDLGVLLDYDSNYDSRVDRIVDTGETEEKNIRAITDFIAEDYGDIEDLFSKDFYLKLVSETYASELLSDTDYPDTITESDFKSDNKNPRMVKRLELYFDRQDINGGIFEHDAPAEYFQNNREEFMNDLDQDSKDTFEDLFGEFNEILSSFEGDD